MIASKFANVEMQSGANVGSGRSLPMGVPLHVGSPEQTGSLQPAVSPAAPETDIAGARADVSPDGGLLLHPAWGGQTFLTQKVRVEQLGLIALPAIREDGHDGLAWTEIAS